MKLKAMLVSSMLAAITACGGSGSSTTTATDTCKDLSNDSFDCQTMLQDINAVAVTKVTELEAALNNLSTDVDTYCDNTSGSLAAIETTFSTTMAVVQQLEVMQFGPIAEARDDFYIWPTNSICRVDEQIAKDSNAALSSIEPSKRGLTAVEYLLFKEDVSTQCLALSAVDTWVNTTVPNLSDRKDARCEFAKRIVDDLEVKATTLKASQTDYDFSIAFDTLQQGANAISDALFYMDTQTKDSKVKAPLPQANGEDFDEAKLESQFANISKENVQNNALAAKAILQAGLDNYLAVKGEQALATKMISALDLINSNIVAITPDFNSVLSAAVASDVTNCINTEDYTLASNDLERLCALQYSVKEFTDLLKKDFVAVVEFSTPSTADGDND